MAYYSISLLVEIGEHFQANSYEEIAGAVFNKRWQGKRLVGLRLAAFFIFFAVTVSICSYFFMLKSELPELIKFALIKFNVKCVESGSYLLNGNFLMLIVILVVILPITFAKNLDFLKYASASGMFSMTFCIVTIVVFKFQIGCSDLVSDVVGDDLLKNECDYEPDHETLKDWTKFQNALSTMQNLSKSGDESVCQAQFFKTSFMDAFGNLFFAFLCHDCIMSIYSELRASGKNGNQGVKFMRVCRYAFAGITSLYMLCGLFGYFTWYDSTISEILLAYSHGYSDNIFIFAARLFVLVTVTFSVPIVHYACRKAFCMLVYGEYVLHTTSSDNKSRIYTFQYGFPVVYLGLISLLVIKAETVQVFFNFGGQITHPTLYVLFPPLFWLLTFAQTSQNKTKIYGNAAMCVLACFVIGKGVMEASGDVMDLFM